MITRVCPICRKPHSRDVTCREYRQAMRIVNGMGIFDYLRVAKSSTQAIDKAQNESILNGEESEQIESNG